MVLPTFNASHLLVRLDIGVGQDCWRLLLPLEARLLFQSLRCELLIGLVKLPEHRSDHLEGLLAWGLAASHHLKRLFKQFLVHDSQPLQFSVLLFAPDRAAIAGTAH